jgi:hypothetical protein
MCQQTENSEFKDDLLQERQHHEMKTHVRAAYCVATSTSGAAKTRGAGAVPSVCATNPLLKARNASTAVPCGSTAGEHDQKKSIRKITSNNIPASSSSARRINDINTEILSAANPESRAKLHIQISNSDDVQPPASVHKIQKMELGFDCGKHFVSEIFQSQFPRDGSVSSSRVSKVHP